MKKNDTPMSVCIRKGYKVLPEANKENVWFINVYLNGKLIRKGKKPVGKGNRLDGRLWQNAVDQAYEHYYNKIK